MPSGAEALRWRRLLAALDEMDPNRCAFCREVYCSGTHCIEGLDADDPKCEAEVERLQDLVLVGRTVRDLLDELGPEIAADPAAPSPDEQPAPDECPMCGSEDRSIRGLVQGTPGPSGIDWTEDCHHDWHRAAPSPDEDTRRQVPPTWEELGATIEEWDAYGSMIHIDGLPTIFIDRRRDGPWDQFPRGFLTEFGVEGERTPMSDEDARHRAAAYLKGAER